MAFSCTLCQKVFKRRYQLQRHIECVHVGEGKHVCMTCQRSFSRLDALLRHESRHEVEKKVYTCEFCDNIFTRKDSLLRHVKTHHTEDSEPPLKRMRKSSPDRQSDELPTKVFCGNRVATGITLFKAMGPSTMEPTIISTITELN